MIGLYPNQMRALAAMCEALDKIEETAVRFTRIGVQDEYGSPLGYLVDEVGGVFSWAPPEWYDERNPVLGSDKDTQGITADA